MSDKSTYVSSTYEDLTLHREAVIRVLRKMHFKVIAMEDYVARNNRMVEQVLWDVAACDIYVGVFAWRYGYVPPDGNPLRLSVTELEYREAERTGMPRLVFILDAKAPWPPQFRDSNTGENDNGERIKSLREEIMQRMCSAFTSPEIWQS